MDREKLLKLLEWPLGEDNMIPRMHSAAKRNWYKKVMEIGDHTNPQDAGCDAFSPSNRTK